MPIVKTDAFVLKSIKYGETSKIVTLFTREFGKINVIVKGARNYKSKLCGTMETMNYISAIVYFKENRELHFLSHAEYKNSYRNILDNFDKLEAAYRIIEIINKSVITFEINYLIFELITKTYFRLNDSLRNFHFYVLHFQIELVKIFGLDLNCSKLMGEEETFFAKNGFYVRKSLINSLRIIYNTAFEELENLEINKNVCIDLILSYERFLSDHLLGHQVYNSHKVFNKLNQNHFIPQITTKLN